MKTYVIHGSPLSGKTTYVNKAKGPNDLIYDFDLVMSAISGLEVHERNNNLIDYVLLIRNLIISKAKSDKDIDNFYLITTKVTEELRESLTGLNAEYVEIQADIDTAKTRLRNQPGNRDTLEWEEAINKYFAKERSYDDFHNTSVWKKKRIVILKRDTYTCKECGRYGKRSTANTVHHILPLEERPDLRLTNNNLVSLCPECHGKMHNRFDDRLSNLGKELKERTIRNYPELNDNK